MYLCGLKTNIDNLSEDELNKIALMREECAKTNQTKEELRQHKKKYNQENKDKKSKWDANYKKKHTEDIAKRREENKERYNEQSKEHSDQKCFEPKENDICTLRTLQKRKRKDVEKYKDIIPNDCIFKTEEEHLQKQKELDDKEKERIKFEEKYGKNQCFDSKEIEICILRTLQDRKKKYPEKYKDMNSRDYIIKSEEEYLQKRLECEKHELEVKKHKENVYCSIRKIIIRKIKNDVLKIIKRITNRIKRNIKKEKTNTQKLIKKKFQHTNENLMLDYVMTQKKMIIVL